MSVSHSSSSRLLVGTRSKPSSLATSRRSCPRGRCASCGHRISDLAVRGTDSLNSVPSDTELHMHIYICTWTCMIVCCACICARCAPFSAKNRMFPANCYAAVRELREVLLGVQRRAPHCCIYENTSGKLAAQLGRVGGAHFCTILPMWCCVNVH